MSHRVLVLGAKGLLGRALLRHLAEGRGPDAPVVLARDKDDLPLEDLAGIARFLREEAVDRIFLLAAWTQVDACEADPAQAFRVNGILPGRLGALASRLSIPVVFLSTDYIFDGEADRPYREYDAPNPLGVYARSKWYGECALREANERTLIVRTSGLYGPGGPDFVQAILSRLEQGPVEVVTDEFCSPTLVDDLAAGLWRLAGCEVRGTWHLAGRGEVSRFEMARRIALLSGKDPEMVRPTTRARLGRPAPRPCRSPLDCQAVEEAFGITLPPWEESLRRFLEGRSPEGTRPS